AVAGRLDDASLMLGDIGIDHLPAERPDPSKGAGLILSHEAAVTGDVRCEDRCEPAFNPLSAQGALPRTTGVPSSAKRLSATVCSACNPRSTARRSASAECRLFSHCNVHGGEKRMAGKGHLCPYSSS